MQSSPWIALLKKLPPEQHHHLMLLTASGIEIALQAILQIEGEALVFKGRLSGSQDAGRLFYVPYDRIDFLGFNRTVGEDEFRAWYGEAPSPAANGEAGSASNGSGPRPTLANRAALLERIRARPTVATQQPG